MRLIVTGVAAIFIQKLLKKEQPVINGDGKQTRDFVFVKDVVNANIKALLFDRSEMFNIGTGRETDINFLFNELVKTAGADCKEIHGMAKHGEQKRSIIDCKKAKGLLGWAPQVSFKDGLAQTVEYFRLEGACL
ncbi:MAG: GDP-mannose 4,6-dehydratase [Deltaproteobacteria bacterium]|nr:GDP-mannose 4,6-dehydratase [Deltaproteobacteria bacterium]